MSRAMSTVVLAVAVVCVTAVGSLAQQQTTSSETKTFEVLAVDGNQLVVRLPEGTRELTVPDDFRFMVNGQPLSVRQLEVGHERHGHHHHANDGDAGHRHRGEERHGACRRPPGRSSCGPTTESRRSRRATWTSAA